MDGVGHLLASDLKVMNWGYALNHAAHKLVSESLSVLFFVAGSCAQDSDIVT